MAPNPRRQDAQLDALYAKLPVIACQGYCHDSCGPIETSLRERQRLERAASKTLTCGAGASCSMLTPDRRCGVYTVRPMICRLWGLTRELKCPYGCEPERYLTPEEAAHFLFEADRIGGLPTGRDERLLREMRAVIGEDEIVRRAGEIIRQTTQRPTLAGRKDSLPSTVIDP